MFVRGVCSVFVTEADKGLDGPRLAHIVFAKSNALYFVNARRLPARADRSNGFAHYGSLENVTSVELARIVSFPNSRISQ